MREFHIPAPNPRQKLFLTDDHRFVAFGGARGGGKSWAIRSKALILGLAYPGIRIMILRKYYQELRDTQIVPMAAMIDSRIATIKESLKECKFVNGSVILFRYAQNDIDMGKLQGANVDVIFVDEATQFTWDQYVMLTAILRGVNDFPHRIYLGCNPGGVGHEWVKRLFVDRQYRDKEIPEQYSFIKSLVTDNTALMRADPDYIHALEALPPKLRRAWLEGEWDVLEGQFFEEFRAEPDVSECVAAGITPEEALKQRRFTHVIEPFEIPTSWQIFRSFDFGYSRPYSCDYWAIDYDGRAYLILQNYGCTGEPNEGVKKNPYVLFPEIAQMEREHRWLKGKHIIGVADPAIWDASTGPSTAEVAEMNHVYFDPGDHARNPGWMQCHYRFTFDENGRPMVYFFNTCKHAIRTIPLLTYSETVPEDLDTDGEDHFADSMRYFFMSRPIAPRVTHKKESLAVSDPLNLSRQ